MKYLKELIERFWNFFPAFFGGVAIFVLSTSSSTQLPEHWISPDKIAHFIAYGGLTFLVLEGFSRTGRLTRSKIILSIFLCTFYGVLLEIIQYTFFPDRYFQIEDAVANFLGAGGGYILFRSLYKIE